MMTFKIKFAGVLLTSALGLCITGAAVPWNTSRFYEWHLQVDSHSRTSLLRAGVVGILFSERSNAPGRFSTSLSETWVLWQSYQQ